MTAVWGTYTTLVTQLQGVEGADGEDVPVWTPGEGGDGVVMKGTAVHEATVAVPYLRVTQATHWSHRSLTGHTGQFSGSWGAVAQWLQLPTLN